jgi:uncharacterized protein YxeA
MKKILLLVVTIVASIIAGFLIIQKFGDKKWRDGYLKATFDEMKHRLKKPYVEINGKEDGEV